MSQETRKSIRKRKKRRLRKRAFFILIPMFLVVVALSYGTYLYVKADSVFSESYEEDSQAKSDLREEKVDPTEDNVSVLIAGVDSSDVRNNSDNARTDTLMLATLNKKDHSVKMLSIPRDSLVYIPEVGYEDKINHAHAYGGMDATRETVENLLDIPVDYYVKLNFEAFIDVVNAVNGITVDVPYELSEQNSKDEEGAIHLMPGEQTLNGEEALALARTRKLDNDIERGKRQQDIIKAVVDKAMSMSSILKYDNIIDAVGTNMTTNMKFGEMRSFVSYGTKGKNLDFETFTLEGSNYMPAGTYYWQIDQTALAETQQVLKNHLDLSTSATASDSDGTTTTSEDPESESSDSY
ncbi:cell envelope-related function transcriptional attenuator common domain-containing protein [Lentibacillus persicus]|uniref:Cell envelope-related function transcriptional attenuator common domain-containing protein n=1 Tax=Lentibacillus persicus TaxID=640948 RepID=A0A1I1XVI0_9BACI|nr:LCP family protein [Lentibacillus persicus]SFE11347.1 cell envelope-related function transcriptional attenuator common domain-containing protein [Lentibacillus persicus]